jgi:hypothetical protein
VNPVEEQFGVSHRFCVRLGVPAAVYQAEVPRELRGID